MTLILVQRQSGISPFVAPI